MDGTLKEMKEGAGRARSYIVDVTDEDRVAEVSWLTLYKPILA